MGLLHEQVSRRTPTPHGSTNNPERTGFGVLCNTSLNFSGKGFINNLADLDTYTIDHGLDGFVVEGRAYLLRTSERYVAYRRSLRPREGSRS